MIQIKLLLSAKMLASILTKLTYIFILLKLVGFGQIMPRDTINYSMLAFDKYYVLEKIIQKNGIEYYASVDKKMIVAKIKDISNVGLCDLKLKLNDTTIYMDWDIETKKISDWYCHHCAGKMTVDQKKNIITVKKCGVTGGRTQKPIYSDRKYKIISLTKTTLIIKDISSIGFSYKFKLE